MRRKGSIIANAIDTEYRKKTLWRKNKKRRIMPVKKVKGGYKYGKTGKVYKQRSKAIKQGKAIAISKKKRKK